ncbi:Glycosyl hydrolase family 57 [Catalinimonas alkaloidigena]|uniref:Glycosyl hydrolase family 57 n=1 Tax=Catalinimonas alkaloidigena TaxID=1075417 RepID=A0A1G9F7T4_9BACT|nr:DUF3536 domain-containing protein [Catalinimonas alkaloidigena]SDK84233.1 Glycosyl hydrolase family 57 [Catalinimonas alkaloidigena]
MGKNKYVCIHGHFYQPPRENPWLNEVEMQESAYPFHDWNARITAECYARNSAARILDEEGRILDIINNYAHISFNFGPTLLEWMEKKAPDVYAAIQDADRESQKRFSGHGSALAQVYNHMIMPLANERDKQTQVIWGIQDFERRFHRKPEGIWLAETAVDTPTLEVLAEHGIKFTILSPYQAEQVRPLKGGAWTEVTGARVDPRQPYLCKLPSGRTISLFFYDGPVSQGIAFEGLLNNGERFAQRLMGNYSPNDQSELMHIATDGESYGHHHRFGEMALSFCLDYIQRNQEATLTIYGEYLEKFPPQWEARIVENSSWSCAHGVERWRSNCGCHTGGPLGGKQSWRGPLREAFDWLRDQLIPIYERQMDALVHDPWAARNDYISVILDRSADNVEAFIQRHARHRLSDAEKSRLMKLMEMQFHALLMYTSCGWFFDEVTGIEAMQDVCYAARAIQIAEELAGVELEPEFVRLLAQAPSNSDEFATAAEAYEQEIRPSVVDLKRVGAHYAISSLFSDYPEEAHVYSYQARSLKYERFEAGKQKLAIGKAELLSETTLGRDTLSFAVLHLGDHHLFGGVREFLDEDAYHVMRDAMEDAFQRSNVHEIIMLMDQHFGMHSYSFWHLFRDDQKKIIDQVLSYTYTSVEGMFQQIYDNNFPIMQVLRNFSMPMPSHLKIPVEFVLNTRIRRQLEARHIDLDELKRIFAEVKRLQVDLDLVTLHYATVERVNQLMEDLTTSPFKVALMQTASQLLDLVGKTSAQLDLWRAQNLCFMVWREHRHDMQQKAEQGERPAQKWLQHFEQLTKSLNMKVDHYVPVKV